MCPTIEILGKTVSTYTLMFFVGLALMIVINILRRKMLGYQVWRAVLYTILIAFLSLVGAKILFMIESAGNGTLFTGSISGVSFFGAVFCLPVFLFIIRKAGKQPYGIFMDYISPSLMAMLAVIRIGCWLNGCCGGITVTHADGTSAPVPTQLIECAGDVAILLILLLIEWNFKGKGLLYPFIMLFYGLLRFIIEFFRSTPKDWLGMSHGQWFAICSVIIGIVFLFLLMSKKGKKKNKIHSR